eukprot:scaffold18239_cov112-Isochrysis_galbana.AAC.2
MWGQQGPTRQLILPQGGAGRAKAGHVTEAVDVDGRRPSLVAEGKGDSRGRYVDKATDRAREMRRQRQRPKKKEGTRARRALKHVAECLPPSLSRLSSCACLGSQRDRRVVVICCLLGVTCPTLYGHKHAWRHLALARTMRKRGAGAWRWQPKAVEMGRAHPQNPVLN